VERILAFAGLSSGAIVQSMVGGERKGWFRGPHELAGAPVTTASVERWRTRLSAEQVALVERAVAPLMARFGYRPVHEAEPDATDLRALARRRREYRRKWRRTRRDEWIRHARYRRPVAAAGHE
jgi:hypothetical protein